MPAETETSIPRPVSVPNGGTGLTAGTSGGIPAYDSTTTMVSSGLLAASALMIGGGAGVAPSTTITGTGVLVGIIARPIFATTATAAGTTTLTVTSASTQEATGSTTQTYTLPVVTTLVAGWATTFINKSTGNITLNSSGGNSIVVLASGQSATLVLKSISADTTAAAWDVVGQSQPLWLVATNDYLVTINATETDLTWTGTIGNMTGALSGGTFTAPTTGKYTFRTLLQYEGTGTSTNPYSGFFTVKLTQSDNTLIKVICATGVPYVDFGSGPYIDGTNTLEWTLSLTAGDTVKHRVYFQDGGDGIGFYFYGESCQLKITQQL